MILNRHSLYRSTVFAFGLTVANVTGIATSQADWPMFRGPSAGSIALEAKLPTEFGGESKENVAWRTELPGRSVGGVIVVGDSVITTSSSGMDQRRLHLISVNAKDGSIKWQQELQIFLPGRKGTTGDVVLGDRPVILSRLGAVLDQPAPELRLPGVASGQGVSVGLFEHAIA